MLKWSWMGCTPAEQPARGLVETGHDRTTRTWSDRPSVCGMPVERAELGAFLQARRNGITPAQAGIEPFPGARRVPGLRRDELAVLAGVSPDYLSRLEQGRQANVSAEVLSALGRALRLSDVERLHLSALASPTRPPTAAAQAPQVADPGLLRVMTTLEHVPVLLLGRRGEVLARNALLQAVLGAAMEPGSSFPRYMFLDPAARAQIVNWGEFAQACVGALRYEAGRQPGDPRLAALVASLRTADPDFAGWWADHGVRDYTSVPKRIRTPVAGELAFDIEVLTGPKDPEQRLVVYTVEPGSATAKTLPLLATWAAGTRAAPAPGTA